jgi:hypothetical protein
MFRSMRKINNVALKLYNIELPTTIAPDDDDDDDDDDSAVDSGLDDDITVTPSQTAPIPFEAGVVPVPPL